MTAPRIAINGFGRIGRLFCRQAADAGLNIVAINDLGDIENLAYLLAYDSVYGRNSEVITADADKKILKIGSKDVRVFQEKDPANLPWKDLDIDVVVESTGIFDSFESAKVHLAAGAKHVVISAPAKDAEGVAGGRTIIMGINDEEIAKTQITSNGSCTTNATAPVVAVLAEKIGVQKAILSTVHAYTATQSIVDGPVKGKDFRRGRAAAQNIAPSTTGAAVTVGKVIPSLAGRFDGLALRVPAITGSLADITFVAARPTSVEEVNQILKEATGDARWQGLLAATEEQIVSTDIVGQPFGAIADLSFTKVIDGDLVKVLSWYDNEAGYVATLLRHVMIAAAARAGD